MKKIYLITLLFFIGLKISNAQNSISGNLKDEATNEPLIGASILVKGTVAGTVTNSKGEFLIKTSMALPVVLKISLIGYETKEITYSTPSAIDIKLKEENRTLEEVNITANRVEESITKSPVTVEKLSAKQIQNSPSPDVYSALQNIKGIDLLTQSLGFKSVNIRGFGANNNNRFVQLTDGMDNRSPGLGFGFGNVAGISDIDIESIEILPGAASALYGPDALQGIMITKSKSAFEYQGLTAQTKFGFNNVGKSYIGSQFYSDIAIRFAKQIGNRFAFKVNFQRLKGTDFIADDYSDRSHRGRPGFFIDDAVNKAVNLGFIPNNDPNNNLQYDGVNIYGDDFNNGGAYSYPANFTGNAALAGKTVTRTGYTEYDLLQNKGDVFSNRANISLYYKISEKVEVNVGWYYGNGNLIRTAGFREYFPDYHRNQFRFELKGDEFFIRAYTTSQTAEGYNLGNLATRILNTTKSNASWSNDFATAFTGNNISVARAFADGNKPMAGSDEFNRKRDLLINTYNNVAIPSLGVNGVRFLDNSSLTHAEGMYNFKKILPKNLEIITGASFRNYAMLTKGTLFPTKRSGDEFTINEYGWYTQVSPTVKLGRDITFKPVVALRYDKNQYFEGGFTPRASAVFSIGQHNFRGSWQSAFRNPSPNQLLADGKTGEVGGSKEALSGANVYNNPIYSEASVNAYRKSLSISDLVKYVPQPESFSTEKINTWEVGYKTLLANRLYIDAFYFNSKYSNFIATQNYIQSQTNNTADLLNTSNGTTYQVNFNNYNEIFVKGWGFGVDYVLGKGYTLSANYANQIGLITAKDNSGNTRKDAFGAEIIERKMSNPEVAKLGRNFFISPENRYNITLANQKLTKTIGMNITYRWTDMMWVEQGTTQGDIWLPSWNTVDAAISIKLPKYKSSLKIGGSNILNKYYSQGYGLANIGGLYYLSINFDEMIR